MTRGGNPTTKHTAPIRVVVGVDASDESDVALREGLRSLQSLPNAELHLVHAARPYVMPPVAAGDAAGFRSGQAYAEMLRALPDQYSRKAASLARQEGVSPDVDEVEVHVRVGGASEVILDVANDIQADLVIVGCRGRTGLRRAVLGSVSERVVRLAPCPVLVARIPQYEQKNRAEKRAASDDAAPADRASKPLRKVGDKSPAENFAFRARRRVRWPLADRDASGFAS